MKPSGTMRGLVLSEKGPVVRHDLPVPVPGPQEALVHVRIAGICSTDLHLISGYKGGFRGVLGHEFVGVVAEAPDHPEWIGDRVVGEINVGCGACDLCANGLGKHCPNRDALGIVKRDGAFADYLCLPVSNLHRVPHWVEDEQAVFVEPLAAALQLHEQICLEPSQRIYVLGDGRLGLLVAQVLGRTGAELTAIGRTAQKLAILADRGINTARSDREDELQPLLEKRADVVVEVTGSPTGFALARRLVRPGGTLALKSTYAAGLANFDLSSLVVDEITLVGSRCGPFAPALRLLAANAVETKALIHGRYSLDDARAALDRAREKGIIKVLLTTE